MEITSYKITVARPSDVTLLSAIELAAARLFVGYAPEWLLAQTTSEEALRRGQSRGQLWVALAGDNPVGFALAEVIEPGSAHLEELDVHPEHGRRGLGRRLVAAVCDWAIGKGFKAITLNTARDVAWNMPFYARLGFQEVRVEDQTPALRAVFDAETRRGLDPDRRLVMRREL